MFGKRFRFTKNKNRKPVVLKEITMKFIIKKLRSIVRNYTTTIMGVGILLTALGKAITDTFSGDVPSMAEIGEHQAAILAGVGLILARDADKSSEDSGV
tara:strand:- start:1359 stop:1655 length:297 start_codon:yes stop_codon:yes gene_type:complete